jgi:hemerythrin
MVVFEWKDSYRTGNATVDAQHQGLFRMVNELHDAIVAGKGKEVLTPTLTKLVKYTVEHFSTEEKLMAAAGYPATPDHHRLHEELTRQVKELAEKYASGKLVLATTLSGFLANWLSHHIQESDITMINYVKAHPAHK